MFLFFFPLLFQFPLIPFFLLLSMEEEEQRAEKVSMMLRCGNSPGPDSRIHWFFWPAITSFSKGEKKEFKWNANLYFFFSTMPLVFFLLPIAVLVCQFRNSSRFS